MKLEQLRQLAEAATPEIEYTESPMGTTFDFQLLIAREQFIAAANPATIIKMLDLIEQMAPLVGAYLGVTEDFRIANRCSESLAKYKEFQE